MDVFLNRRTLLAATGVALVLTPQAGRSAPRKTLRLELISRELALRPGQPATAAWRFARDAFPRVSQGDEVDVTIANRLPSPVLITWRGLDGAPMLAPLLTRGPIAAGGSEIYALNLRHAGTLICDARLTRDLASASLPMLPILVSEASPQPMDRDEVLLIEDWRLQANGRSIPPAADPAGSETVYTINGTSSWALQTSAGERLRLRFINGTQRAVVSMQLSSTEVRVVAIDGQPSEPFPARDGRLVLAPGTRIDTIVEVLGASDITLDDGSRGTKIGQITTGSETRRAATLKAFSALPSNGLPEKLALQSALRIDLKTDASSGWQVGSAISSTTSPAFRVARGRTVVLALSNPSDTTTIFRLQGHHMRLLDRLDDGWKPFWLDTVAIPAKQTLRVAFSASVSGAYLMEICGTDWAAATLLRTYSVDG